jgi:hypothetical protein
MTLKSNGEAMTDEYKPLFTPDTLADGYEAALFATLARLLIRDEIVSTIRVLRVSHPDVYMRLCYIAKEHDKFALRDTIVILVSIGFLPDTNIAED